MLNDETRRKLRVLNIGEFIEELEIQQQDPQTLALPFDDRFQLLTDSVYQRKYNEKVRRLIKNAKFRLPDLLGEYAEKSLLPGGKNKVLNKYAAFKVLVLDEWLMPELSKADVEFLLELTERRFDSTSTIFCTLYKREDWVKRLRGGTYAESIVERFAHNTTWVETGDVNMRQYLSHA